LLRYYLVLIFLDYIIVLRFQQQKWQWSWQEKSERNLRKKCFRPRPRTWRVFRKRMVCSY